MLAIKPERPISPIHLRPGVKSDPPMQYRVRFLKNAILSKSTGRNRLDQPTFKGENTFAGTVCDVLPKDYAMLRACSAAVRVDDNTPLHNAPPPIDDSTQIPARFLELVAAGLNTLADLAQELRMTKGNIAKIAARFIAEGTVKLSDKGAYLIAKKA
jgi:hypothetical protein